MPSSFKKLSQGKFGPLPPRRVHVRDCVSTEDGQESDPSAVLMALEERLISLEQKLLSTYKSLFESGRAEGYQQGYQDGRKEADELVQAASRELRAVRQERETFAREYKGAIVDLIVTICKKLLVEQVVKPEVVIPLVEDALQSLHPPLEATIYCPPNISQELRWAANKLSATARGSVEIIADPLLPDHVMRVESENTVLEINVVNELEAIAAELGVELES